jgi:peptidoglycan hydrolase-like protein with peptidoglycan-binding domain
VLRAHGYYQGPIDGLIGPESRAALRRFQEEHGLPQTGTITPEVLDGLGIVAN